MVVSLVLTDKSSTPGKCMSITRFVTFTTKVTKGTTVVLWQAYCPFTNKTRTQKLSMRSFVALVPFVVSFFACHKQQSPNTPLLAPFVTFVPLVVNLFLHFCHTILVFINANQPIWRFNFYNSAIMASKMKRYVVCNGITKHQKKQKLCTQQREVSEYCPRQLEAL